MEADDVESVIFTVRPTLLFVKIGYLAAIIGAVLLTVLLAMISIVEIPWYFSLPVALGLLLIPAYYHLKRNMIRYTLTDSKIEIDYVPGKLCVESKSLKFYLASFRNERAFNEAITNRILDDFVRACTPREVIVTAAFSARGGIALTVRATSPDGAKSGQNGR